MRIVCITTLFSPPRFDYNWARVKKSARPRER